LYNYYNNWGEKVRDLIIKLLNNSKKEVLIEFFVCIILRAILLVIPILYSQTINSVSSSLYENAVKILIIYIILISLYKLFEYIRQYTFYKVYNKLYKDFTTLGMQYTYKNSIFSLSRFTNGSYLNIMNSDIDTICSFFTNAIYRVAQMMEFVFIFYYFFTINSALFIITLSASLIVLMFIVLSSDRIQKYNKYRKDTFDKKTSTISDIFSGIKEIKGFNIGKHINNKAISDTNRYTSANAKYSTKYNIVNIISVYAFELLRLLLLIYGVYQVSIGNMEIGILVIIYSYYQKIIDNSSLLTTLNLEYKNLKMSLSRYNKLFEFVGENSNNKMDVLDIKGDIEFNHVLYGYRNDPTLSDFTLKVKSNSISAITGKTGSGKTGVVDLLTKMNRQLQGMISLDGIDISAISDESYYNLVSVARKEPFFFNTSIKDNLMILGKTEEEIQEVCKKLGVHEKILELEKGYDTIMNNDDSVLSSSVKRLLAIARVLLKDTRIYLFDEIIETLDKSNRDIIMKILKEKKKNHTILIISRDSRILKQVDNVILMNNGVLIDTGTHEELLQNNRLYSEIN
jgi:ABC-type bacteriocin/lantibiotic exporter with double-glycine peptidase domain